MHIERMSYNAVILDWMYNYMVNPIVYRFDFLLVLVFIGRKPMANINILLNEFQKDLHLSISDNTHIKVKIWIIEKFKR